MWEQYDHRGGPEFEAIIDGQVLSQSAPSDSLIHHIHSVA